MDERPVVILLPEKKKRKLWWMALCVAVLLLLAAAGWFLTADMRAYQEALALEKQGAYLEAAAVFEELGDYEDAPERLLSSRYAHAEKLRKGRSYADAFAVYETLGNYEKSDERLRECCYKLGETARKAGELDTAIDYFTRAGDEYLDAKDMRLQTVYDRGHELFLNRKEEEAQVYFDRLLEEAPEYYIPHFSEPKEAIEYMKSVTGPMETLSVAVGNISPFYKNMDYWNAAVQQSLGYQFADVTLDEKEQTVTLVPDYYPGQKIVWAWQSGDFSGLSEKEQQTFDAAMALVEQGRGETEDIMELELWLHDWICTHVEYDSPYSYVYPEDYVGLDELTCIGAILNGKANCQGYTDAFYLLGTLAGMEVHKVFGMTEEGHCWNAVRLDGWLYTVDVTFNDTSCYEPDQRTYVWYNNALDMNQYSVFGGVSQFDKMVFLQDESKTYYAMHDLIFEDLDDAVLTLLKRYRQNGSGMDYALVKETGIDDDVFYDAVVANMGAAGVYNVQWWMVPESYKEATYITVCWQ